MIAKCVNCGAEYQLNDVENPKDFQCDCGGSLEERRTLNDYKKIQNEKEPKKGYNTNEEDYKSNLSVEGQKKDLFSRGYNLIDENEEEYIFKKEVSGLPVWALIVISIVLFPIGVIIALFLYFFYKKQKIKMVEKESTTTS